MQKKISIFSFFSGIGILDLAFEKNGYNIVFVNEYDNRILYMPHILLINSFGYMLRARSILRVELLVSKNNRSDK